jgi:hypothetical protein
MSYLFKFFFAKEPGKPSPFIAKRLQPDFVGSGKWRSGEDHAEK